MGAHAPEKSQGPALQERTHWCSPGAHVQARRVATPLSAATWSSARAATFPDGRRKKKWWVSCEAGACGTCSSRRLVECGIVSAAVWPTPLKRRAGRERDWSWRSSAPSCSESVRDIACCGVLSMHACRSCGRSRRLQRWRDSQQRAGSRYTCVGSDHRIPTLLLANMAELQSLQRKCSHSYRHVALSRSIQVSGECKFVWRALTSLAGAHPARLCRQWAVLVRAGAPAAAVGRSASWADE